MNGDVLIPIKFRKRVYGIYLQAEFYLPSSLAGEPEVPFLTSPGHWDPVPRAPRCGRWRASAFPYIFLRGQWSLNSGLYPC
jgi:hypothetical protein